MLHYFS